MSKKRLSLKEAVFASLQATAGRPNTGLGTFEVADLNENVLSQVRYVVTTGIKAFDDIVGGFPIGRITELYGLESCGKTAMSIRAAARAGAGFVYEISKDASGEVQYRKLDEDEFEIVVFYIDNEQSLDDDHKLTVDGYRLNAVVGRTDTIEATFKAVDNLIEIVEKRTAQEAEKKGKRKLQFAVIVVDTIASTSSKDELAAQWGKRDFPRLPAEISRGFSKLVRRINVNNVCMICTNQVRIDYNAAQQMSVDDSCKYRSPGGMALRYYASHRVFMQASQGNYRLRPESKFASGLKITFRTVKNRIHPPLRNGRMVLLFDRVNGGLNDAFSTLETMVYTGAIEVTAKEKGTGFKLKCRKHGISPGEAATEADLESDDDNSAKGGRSKDPGFTYRAEWPSFLEANKELVETLWTESNRRMFATLGLAGSGSVDAAENEDEENEDEDDSNND